MDHGGCYCRDGKGHGACPPDFLAERPPQEKLNTLRKMRQYPPCISSHDFLKVSPQHRLGWVWGALTAPAHMHIRTLARVGKALDTPERDGTPAQGTKAPCCINKQFLYWLVFYLLFFFFSLKVTYNRKLLMNQGFQPTAISSDFYDFLLLFQD